MPPIRSTNNMNSDIRKQLPMNTRNQNNKHSEGNLIQYPREFYPEELLEDSHGLDLKEFINILKKNKKLVLMTALLSTLLALLVTVYDAARIPSQLNN